MPLANPTEILDNFNSLANWNTSGQPITVLNNKVSGNGSPNGQAWIDITPTNVFRMEFYLTPNSSPDNGIFCGVSTATGAGAPSATANWKAIAYRNAYGGIVLFNGGTNTVIIPSASVIANKKYRCQIVSTGTEVFFTVSNEDGSGDKTVRIAENVQAAKVIFQVCDTTDYIEKLSWKPALSKYSDPTFDVPMVLLPTIGADRAYIRVPSDFNGALRNAVLLCHGYTTDATSMWRDRTNERSCNDILVANGYITAAADGHGNNWGNAQSTTDLEALRNYLITTFGINTKVGLFLNSMGGLTGFNYALAYPSNIKGIIGTAPVTDLTFVANATDFSSTVFSAYATTKANFYKDAKGKDPHIRFKELINIPMKIWHASDDTTINYNVSKNLKDTMDLIGGNANLTTVTGGHSSALLWVPADVLSFANSIFAI